MPAARSSDRLRVVVDARLVPGEAGGVEGVVIGLAHGLSQLDGPEEYVFVARDGQTGWLEPYLAGGTRVTTPAASAHRPRPKGPVRLARRLVRAVRGGARAPGRTPSNDGVQPARPSGLGGPGRDPFVEALQPGVVHMPIQRAFLAASPSIYHPHDLQHLHLPEFFSDGQRAWRDRWYGALCRHATMVAVATDWTRRDVMSAFELPADKVRVVPLAPPLVVTRPPTAEERAAVRARLALPERFALYPAQTWPHKNHLRLLEALALLRSHGVVVPLVATGRQTEHFPQIEAAARDLGVDGQIVWTGFLPALELQALYLEARAVVIPTLFEAASGPLWEAFAAGVPAACSNVTSLPEQAGDAAVIFDPLDPEAIASALSRVWQDEALREVLITSGRERVAELSWERTARIFRAHYRRLAGRPLSDEDVTLVGEGLAVSSMQQGVRSGAGDRLSSSRPSSGRTTA